MPTNYQKINELYRALEAHYGPQRWWPAKSSFEVIVGAYLTQNTSWNNVVRALNSLRKADRLNVEGIRSLPMPALKRLIRASGFYRQKSRSLKTFIQYLDARHAGSVRRMFARHRTSLATTHALRKELLELSGVGQETADSILLYGGNLPVFVVDAYTRRIFLRHRIVAADATYEDIRAVVERAFGHNGPRKADGSATVRDVERRRNLARQFNEMHALLVRVGKDHCYKSSPDCEGCPLRELLPEKQLLKALREEARGRRR
jgi:endonuclease III related protein